MPSPGTVSVRGGGGGGRVGVLLRVVLSLGVVVGARKLSESEETRVRIICVGLPVVGSSSGTIVVVGPTRAVVVVGPAGAGDTSPCGGGE